LKDTYNFNSTIPVTSTAVWSTGVGSRKWLGLHLMNIDKIETIRHLIQRHVTIWSLHVWIFTRFFRRESC